MIIKYFLDTLGFNETQYEPIVDEVATAIKKLIHYILIRGVDVLAYILRPLYIILIVYGLIKYTASGLNQRSKNILVGGVVLAVFTEGVLPLLLQYLK